jgi:acyl-CoA reductase-like NAD-dependent aldehyde dehydrogenase
MTETLDRSAHLLPEVQSLLAGPQNLVLGAEQTTAKDEARFETWDPSDGEVLAVVAHAQAEDVDKAVSLSRAALEGPWGRMSPSERGRLLYRLAELVEQNSEGLAQLESLDNGTPQSVTSGALLPGVVAHLRHFAGWADKITGTSVDTGIAGVSVHLEREPVGVVAAIVPWNFPLTMATWKIAPALAAGCTVILKPAEQTPLSALWLGRLALEAGIPPGVLQVLPGFGETTGAALVAHPGVDKIAFTGSVEVGQAITRSAVTTMKRVSLELGGKSPSVVMDDADLELAVASAAAGIFFNSGQVCSASSRLLVQSSVFDEVVDGVVKAAAEITVGPALDPATVMGPLISQEQLERVSGYVEGGVGSGGRVLTGGEHDGSRGFYYNPTVVVDAPLTSAIVREEVFGPVVVAQSFDSLETLAERANDTPFGLAAAIFTTDPRNSYQLSRMIRAGNVWVNCYGYIHPAVPFGGFKMSGAGRDGGKESLDQYLETKAIWTNHAW